MRKSTRKKWQERKKEMVSSETVAAAIHEAGHAVADELLRNGVEYVEIHNKILKEEVLHAGQRYSHGISTGYTAAKPRNLRTLDDLEKECIATWAGPTAEAFFTGKDAKDDGDLTSIYRLIHAEDDSGKKVFISSGDDAKQYSERL